MRHTLPFLLLAVVTLLPGCSHYRMGPPGQLAFQSIYVAPVQNRSYAPQASAELTTQIVDSMQDHGNLTVVEHGSADVTLETTIIDYQRIVGATQQADTALAESYVLVMQADITLRDNRSGKVLMNSRRVSADQQAFVQGGFQIAEYQAMPVLTRELASNITDEVVSVW